MIQGRLAHPITLFVIGCLCSLPTVQGAPADAVVPDDPSATNIDHSDDDGQLEAIRQGLVETALEGPTRVQSSAWIDSEGVLHENTRIQSDVEIRGFRMDQYLPQGSEEMTGTSPETASPMTEVLAQACAKSLGLRATGEVVVNIKAGPTTWEYPYLQRIAEATSEAVLRVFNQSGDWALREPLPVAMVSDPYQAAVEGQIGGDSDYRVHIEIRPSDLIAASLDNIVWLDDPAPKAVSTSLGVLETLRHHASKVVGELKPWRTSKRVIGAVLRVDLIKPGSRFPGWSERLHLVWTDPRPGLSQPQLGSVAEQQLQRIALNWQDSMMRSMDCTPLRFAVIEVIDNLVLIGGGADAGLRIGDRLVIADGARVPKYILEAGVAEEMFMGEVVSVGPSWARLRPLTRPMPSSLMDSSVVPSTFVALPL